MKKSLPVLVCVCFIQLAFGQSPYAEINLASNVIDDIQAFEVHDSVFLTYTEKDVRRAFWIDAGGKTNQAFLNHVGDIHLCGIQKYADTTFFYYLKEVDKVLLLSSLKQSSHGGNIYSGGNRFNVSGDVLGIHVDDEALIVVSYQKKTNRMEIISLYRGMKAGAISLDMPGDFSRHALSSGFIRDGGMATIDQGSAPTKIYREGRSVILIIDERRFSEEKSTTRVIKVDLSTGGHETHVLPGPGSDKFTSFYHNNMLFRLAASDKSLEWFVYDVQTGESLYSKRLDKDKSLVDRHAVRRVSESHEVWRVPWYEVMTWGSLPSIVVERIPNTTDLRIVSGSYQNSKGMVLSDGMTPLAILAGLVVRNVINQLEPAPGIKRYFYLVGNVDKGFDFEPSENPSTPFVRQTIDDYEISRTSGVAKNQEEWHWFLLYKGYLELKDGAVGIYQEKRKTGRKLILLKYKAAGLVE